MGIRGDRQWDISASWCLGRYRYDNRRLIRKVRWVLQWLPEHHIIILCSVYIGFCRHCKKSSAATDTPYGTAPVDKAIVYNDIALETPRPIAVTDIASCTHFDLAI